MKKTIIAMLALSGVAFGDAITDLVADSGYNTGDSYTLSFTINSGVSGGHHVLFTLTDNWTLNTEIGQYIGFSVETTSGIGGNLDGVTGDSRKNPFTGEVAEDAEGWVFDSGAAGNLANVNVTLAYDGGDTTKLTLKKGENTWVDATLKTDIELTDVTLGSGITGVTITSLSVTPAAPDTPAIPEPTTATLSLLALAGLAARRRRK